MNHPISSLSQKATEDDPPPEYSLFPVTDKTECSEIQIQRLRRFLQFRLLVDYDCVAEGTSILLAEDFRYFTALATWCFHQPGLFEIRDLGYTDHVASENPFVDSQLLLPAKALGIPGGVALAMLQLFTISMSWNKTGYESPMWISCQAHGMEAVATKLCFDRERLVPLLFCDSKDFQEKVSIGLECYATKWFKDLTSPKGIRLTLHGQCLHSQAKDDRGDGVDGWIGRHIHRRVVRQGCRLSGWIVQALQVDVENSPVNSVRQSFTKWRPFFFLDEEVSPSGSWMGWFVLCRISCLFPDKGIDFPEDSYIKHGNGDSK